MQTMVPIRICNVANAHRDPYVAPGSGKRLKERGMNIVCALRRCVIGMALLLSFAMPAVAEAASPRVVVEKFYSSLLGAMQEADKLGFDGRVQRLTPAIQETFDTPAMARTAVGPRWNAMTEGQREQVVEAFSRFVVATFANRFDGYANEKFVVKGIIPTSDNNAMVVQSQMLRSEGDPVTLNFVLRQAEGDAWRISDILFGAVSELANRRAEFTSVIRRDGVDGLISELNKKIKDLEQ